MLTTEQLVTLARASSMYGHYGDERSAERWDKRIHDLALDALGRPDEDTIVTSALGALQDGDRNLRVAAMRVLWWHHHDPRVAEPILRATYDAVRRVRRVAAGMCWFFIEHPGVAERLREIVEDPEENRKIAGVALSSLASSAGRTLPESVLRSVSDLLQSDDYRRRILVMLLHQRVDDASRAILREIVRLGTKDEAVRATRALCGYRVVNIGSYPPGDERRRIQDTADPLEQAGGGRHTVLYWVRD